MGLEVKQFVNESLTSNAYVVRLEDSFECLLVDIGEYTELKKHLALNGLSAQALFLTHCHYDHILGIREFMNEFPTATTTTDTGWLMGICQTVANYLAERTLELN